MGVQTKSSNAIVTWKKKEKKSWKRKSKPNGVYKESKEKNWGNDNPTYVD